MRVPLSWLRDYVDFDLPAGAPGRAPDAAGHGGPGASSASAPTGSSVVVGELLEVGPHPNADRLSLTRVRVSDTDAPLSIVCGATNIAAGQRVPVALPGAVLPGDRRIGVTTIQGTESQGMLCSGAELGLSADADGILILDGLDTRLGQPLAEVVGDVVLDVDVKPNRGDALSHDRPRARGRRDLRHDRCAGRRSRCPSRATRPTITSGSRSPTSAVPALRRPLRRRRAGSAHRRSRSQLRLTAAGMRPVSNVVDASQLRDARAGQADPHVRRRGRERRHDRRPHRARRGAARDARPRRARR